MRKTSWKTIFEALGIILVTIIVAAVGFFFCVEDSLLSGILGAAIGGITCLSVGFMSIRNPSSSSGGQL